MSEQEILERALRRAERERAARVQAEQLLEQKSLELYRANEELRQQSARLELTVSERTRQLEEAAAQANAATKAKSDFLATMSHEIRTPLSGIIGLTELLDLEDLTGEQKRLASLANQSARHLLSLLNNLLDLKKIEAEEMHLDEIAFSPRRVLDECVAAFMPAAGRAGIELQCEVGTLPQEVVGDPVRLAQILHNLLGNAIKFTLHGSVRMDAECTGEGDRFRLRVSVSDTGIGIDPDAIDSLFEPFRQAKTSTAGRFGGTGLGLAITKKLVEAMGGSLSATAAQKGSVFRFDVLFGAAAPRAPGIPPCEDDGVPEISLLLVEDNEVIRMVVLGLLKALGRQADTASTGEEAVTRVSRKVYDLVLMDLQLPGMDGMEAARQIRKLSLARQPQIVALTANAFVEDRRKCIEAGMDGFLAKPVQIRDLRTLICRACPLHASSCPQAR